MKLSELANELTECEMRGEAEVSSLCVDSRVAGEGDLFFCFRGTNVDSHAFAADAVKRGACAVVCERPLDISCPQLLVPDGRKAMAELSAAFFSHPERSLRIVGITGTNGKTTVAHMLRNILAETGVSVGIIGTLGAGYANKTVAPALTTPDPVFLFSLLADMKKSGVSTVVMETSAHALALKKELPIVYEVGVFTNLTQDHLDFFGDMERYGEAKRSMFTRERCKFAVLNADDPFTATLEKGGMPYATYGLDTPADAFALADDESLGGSYAMLNLNDELCEAEIRLPGKHNLCNALAAAVAARRMGADLGAIARGLERTERVDGRLERVASFRGADIFVDFAHTPDGLKQSLLSLRAHCKGKLLLLFGCGGNRDSGKRPLMGEIAATYSDFSVITSDNPRYEDPCEIIAEIEAGYRPVSKNYVAVEERERATEYALKMLSKGDVLLVAGKGGETYQEIMGIKYSYNDKDVIKSLFGKLS